MHLRVPLLSLIMSGLLLYCGWVTEFVAVAMCDVVGAAFAAPFTIARISAGVGDASSTVGVASSGVGVASFGAGADVDPTAFSSVAVAAVTSAAGADSAVSVVVVVVAASTGGTSAAFFGASIAGGLSAKVLAAFVPCTFLRVASA